MGHKRKKMPRRPHCKVAPKEITPAKKAGGTPDFEVRIRISKRPKVDHYSGDIEATNTTALIEALAVLIQKAAGIIGAPTEKVYAVIAATLFSEPNGMEEVEPEQTEER